MNKKIVKRLNKPLYIYDEGGKINPFDSKNIAGNIGGLASSVGTIFNAGLQNSKIADTSSLEGQIKNAKTYQVGASNNDDLMKEWNMFSPMSNISWKDIRGGGTGQMIGNTLGAVGSGIGAGASVGGGLGAAIGGAIGLIGSIGGIFAGNSKAKRKARALNKDINEANNRQIIALNDRAANIDFQNDLNMLANYSAFGGPISVSNHGGDFSNGITFINNGGSHENNPFNGVLMGVSPEGIPNMVEEGEVKFNNYIFSNRLIANKDLLDKYKLSPFYENHSFAFIAEKLNKESSERPNDPISKKGLNDSMMKLQQAQEEMKNNKKERKENKNIFAKGGPLGDLYSLTYPNGNYNYNTSLLMDPVDMNKYQIDPDSLNIENTSKSNNRGGLGYSLMYAPVIGGGLGVLSDMIGLTNKPNYDNADLIGKSLSNQSKLEAPVLGNYLTYKPLDRNYYLNKLNSQASATRNAIVNQAGGNRASIMAGLLASDYNTTNAYGDLIRKSEEYNQQLKERVEAFNRGTNQFNAEMALRTAIANKEDERLRLHAKIAEAQMREKANERANIGRSANLTNFLDSLGEIGRMEFSKNMINSNPANYYYMNNDGTISYKNDKPKRRKTKNKYLTIE